MVWWRVCDVSLSVKYIRMTRDYADERNDVLK